MANRPRFVAIITTVAASVVWWCTACSANSTSSVAERSRTASTTGKVVHMGASWATYFTDLRTMVQSSDLIVLGNVASHGQPQMHKKSDEDPGYVTTNSNINVVAALGKPTEHPTSVEVVQTGGSVAGVEYEVGDDPLYRIGSQLVLFLMKNDDGTYRANGGPSGRFTVTDGFVSAFAPDGVPLKNTNLADFEKTVAAFA